MVFELEADDIIESYKFRLNLTADYVNFFKH